MEAIKISDSFSNESMLDIYLFETSQLVEQLEKIMLDCEKTNDNFKNNIDEIFRIMHTIKGSSAMMHFENAANLAHKMEDLFYFIRENKDVKYDYQGLLDIVLESIDFAKERIRKAEIGERTAGNPQGLIIKIGDFLENIKKAKEFNHTDMKSYEAIIKFEQGCGLENMRAYGVIHNLKSSAKEIKYFPEDIEENDKSSEIIQQEGFKIFIKTDSDYEELYNILNNTILLKEFDLKEVVENNETISSNQNEEIEQYKEGNEQAGRGQKGQSHQNIVSVDVTKLDKLMDLVGEMVIAETMVTQNPELKGLQLDGFQKAARQLRKIHSELQDTVMSIRMVPLATTFFKMQRIVRDMSKKLNKGVELEIVGEETEVDKSIIEHISDPLMHLIRNAVDHGIESPEERKKKGKIEIGKVTLEARNEGGEVLIIIKDDGGGLDKPKILKRAKEHGLMQKNEEEMTEKEIFSLILLPGFSTNDSVTEYSGRGVGMDVVAKGIETIGGTVIIDSVENQGTSIILKIPLTLAIIDGMNIAVGDSSYTIPISAIRESFKATHKDLICDPDGNEMIMIRGECYPILRLHKKFYIEEAKTDIAGGIIIVVSNEEKTVCLFADELLGEQQVVVKTLPKYIRNTKKIKCLAGCTLLGDGNISLILDVAECVGA